MSIHGFLERTGLPLLVIVLIPIAAVLYLVFGANENSSTPTTPTQTTPVAVQTNTPSATPSASISLNDPSSLSKTVPAGQFIPFSFTIQNTGATGGSIPYRVSVTWSTGEEDVIDENVVTLQAGASTSIDENLKFEIATETAQVTLELPQTGQSMQFALPRTQ